MPSSAKAVKVNGSAVRPGVLRGAVMNVAPGGGADLAARGVAEAVVVLRARARVGHPAVNEELVGVQRAGGLQRAGLAVPDGHVREQLADLRARRHRVAGADVEELAAGPLSVAGSAPNDR
jgi:hypothetical protein